MMACTTMAVKNGPMLTGYSHAQSLLPSSSLLTIAPVLRRRALPTIKAVQTSTPPADSSPKPMPDLPSSTNASEGTPPSVLSQRWQEIQGEKNWEGLMDHPIDPTLRAEIIRYGEFSQVTYDSFDFYEHSLYCGSCKYSRRTLFQKVDKGNCGYEVTKYLYATSDLYLPKFLKRSDRAEYEHRWTRDSNWIGYVAVCTDEAELKRIGRRDILVAWRGTITKTEWVDDLMTNQVPATIETAVVGGSKKPIQVESGFLSLYSSSKPNSRFNKLSAGQQMLVEVQRLVEKYKGEEISISITGHSLGAALALLCAYDIAANIVPQAAPPAPTVTVFSFAGPRVGNRAWKKRVEELGVKVLRIVNQHDIVPKVPGVFFNENSPEILDILQDGLKRVWPKTSGYHHVGKELLVDFDLSPHLRRNRELPDHHNLEAYLHVMDGFQGLASPFQSTFGRNPFLVNKSSDFLREDALIPASWWQESNKGLVKDPISGQWVIATRDAIHLPEVHHP